MQGRVCGRSWSRARTRCGAVCYRLELPELARDIQRQGGRARLIADVDEIVQSIASEMRSGDVVAILSNGGFGGIYDKLPGRLRALAGEAERGNSANAAGKR